MTPPLLSGGRLAMICCSLWLLGMAACATKSPTPTPAKRAPPSTVGVSLETLPSGMRLVAREDARASEVRVSMSYRVGASDEPVGKEGVGLLSLLLTRRARSLDPATSWMQGQQDGLQGGPSFDFTYDETQFFSAVPAARFDELMALEEKRMREPLAGITEKDFQDVRDQMMLVMSKREGTLTGAQLRWLNEKLLPGHSYGRPREGTPESFARVTLDDAREFVKAHYTPAHAVLVVSGPMPMADVKFEVARIFAAHVGTGMSERIPPVRHIPPPFPEELPPGTPMAVVEGGFPIAQLYMVWTVPGLYSGMDVLSRLAAESMEFRAWSGLKRKDRRVRIARSKLVEMDGMSMIILAVDFEPGAVLPEAELRALVEPALELDATLRSHAPSMAGWAQRHVMFRKLQQERDANSVAEVARVLRATGRTDVFRVREEQLQSIDSKDPFSANALALYMDKYIRPERARLMFVKPKAPAPAR